MSMWKTTASTATTLVIDAASVSSTGVIMSMGAHVKMGERVLPVTVRWELTGVTVAHDPTAIWGAGKTAAEAVDDFKQAWRDFTEAWGDQGIPGDR